MGYHNPYFYGYTLYTRKDALVVKGPYYVSVNASSQSGSFSSNTTKYFYGYYTNDDGSSVSHPLALMNYQSNNSATFGFMNMSAIQSGGTVPVKTGNFVAYVRDANRKGGTTNPGGGSWFESIYLDWNSWSSASGINRWEVWYRESADNANWSGRVLVKGWSGSGTSGNYTIGSVNQTTSSSNWGTRGRYYQWCVVGCSPDGYYSNTSFWSASRRKCTTSAYSFNANGGSGAPATQYKFPAYDFKFPSTTPTRTGYTFKGWSTSSTATSGYSVNQIVTGLSDANTTWYATWKANNYTLTLNANGGTVGTGSVTVTYNSSNYYEMAWNIPSRAGYTFKGWYTAKSGGKQIYGSNGYVVNDGTYWSGNTWKYTGNLTLYAQWTPITYTNYIIHRVNGFVNKEGNDSEDKKWYNLGNTSFTGTCGVNHTVDASRARTIPKGFELSSNFASASLDGTPQSYAMGTVVTQRAWSMNYYYYYNPNSYTLTYNLNGGTNSSSNPSSYNILYGVTLNNPTKTGNTFSHWVARTDKNTFTMNASTGNYNWTELIPGLRAEPGTSYTIHLSSALTSGTATQYTVLIYDFTTDTGLADETRAFGNNQSFTLTCPSTADASHDIRIIIYAGTWGGTAGNATKYTDAYITYKATGVNPGENGTFSSANDLYYKLNSRTACNLTFTANWSANKYTVTFNANGGYTTPTTVASKTFTYNNSYEFPGAIYAKPGYVQIGWNSKADGTGTNYSLAQTGTWTVTSNLTVYAKWRAATTEEQKIYLYNNGYCEAINFAKTSDWYGFKKGVVGAKDFTIGSPATSPSHTMQFKGMIVKNLT